MVNTLSSAPSRDLPPEPRPPAMQPLELGRWAWRQLTSMRTALVLLFLLALAAVPGSLVPQRSIDPNRVAQFAADHPALDPWYERLSLYSVYSSPWFAATYLLLFVSLVGCVLPRSRQHLSAVLARPPRAPRNLDRLPFHTTRDVAGAHDEVLARARQALRDRGYRVDVADGAVAAEKGYLRETGNLVFHVALLLLLLAVALGHLFGYKANVLVVEGEAFSNTVSAYDTFTPGPLANENALAPFTVKLDSLRVRYQETGMQVGAPRDFQARLSYTSSPDAAPRSYDLRVNHPLKVDGVKVFLLGNGYAPVFTVRDKDGTVVSRGPVPFLPRDGNNTSMGVLKVTGTSPQIGLDGLFLPTAVIDQTGPHSVFPGLKFPRALLSVWRGDLGLGSGTPQSVYQLDKKGLTQVVGTGGRKLVVGLAPGTSATLPSGETITMDGVRRWASLQVARDPGMMPALFAALLALGGLMLSLFVRRRRVWVRVGADEGGRTLIEVAGLARTEGEGGDGLADEVAELADEIDRTGAAREL